MAEVIDKGRDVVDGRREIGSGVLVSSAEFGNFGTCIVDIRAEGGNEFIVGVLVALVHRFQFEQVGIKFVDASVLIVEAPFMVDGVHTEVANLSVEGVELVQETIFQLGQRVGVLSEAFVHPGEPVRVVLFARSHRRSKVSEAFVHPGEPGIQLCIQLFPLLSEAFGHRFQQGVHQRSNGFVQFLIQRSNGFVQFLTLSTKDMSDRWGGSDHGLVQSLVGVGSLVV
jgi:hypothetical protein